MHLKVPPFDWAVAVNGVVYLLDWTVVRLLVRGRLGVGVGSIVVELLLVVRQVSDDGSGLLAAAGVQVGVVELEGGGGCATD